MNSNTSRERWLWQRSCTYPLLSSSLYKFFSIKKLCNSKFQSNSSFNLQHFVFTLVGGGSLIKHARKCSQQNIIIILVTHLRSWVMNSIHCGWGENLLNALGQNYCVSFLAAREELVAFCGMGEGNGCCVEWMLIKTFCSLNILRWSQSRCRVAATFWGKHKQATRAPTKHKTIWMNMPKGAGRGGLVKTLSLPRLATDDDETAGAATTTTTMMITDSSGQTHNYTTQHICISVCVCPMIVPELLKTKVLPKLISFWKYSPKICANHQLCWKNKANDSCCLQWHQQLLPTICFWVACTN